MKKLPFPRRVYTQLAKKFFRSFFRTLFHCAFVSNFQNACRFHFLFPINLRLDRLRSTENLIVPVSNRNLLTLPMSQRLDSTLEKFKQSDRKSAFWLWNIEFCWLRNGIIVGRISIYREWQTKLRFFCVSSAFSIASFIYIVLYFHRKFEIPSKKRRTTIEVRENWRRPISSLFLLWNQSISFSYHKTHSWRLNIWIISGDRKKLCEMLIFFTLGYR